MRKIIPLLMLVMLTAGVAEAAVKASPGFFRQGRFRFGLYGGAGSSFSQTYAIVGGGLGYYVLSGLEAGLDYEAWFGNSPTIQKFTPQLRYVFWQPKVKPYLGVFWRRTTFSEEWPDYDSWGGRFGVAYQQGRNYFAIGIVHEEFLDNGDVRYNDDSLTYPEIAFWFSF